MDAIQQAIELLVENKPLAAEQLENAVRQILSGEATPSQIGGLLIGLRMRGETAHELLAFARVMREFAAPAPIDQPDDLVDTCGTGGTNSRKFNISTAAAIVAAGAGCRVAKHGNRAMTSATGSGSADVLAALGVKIDCSPQTAVRCLEKCGIAFFFAPAYHSAMRHVATARREIGVRSIFNLLGPLVNPVGARRQLIGVGRPDLTELFVKVLAELGSHHVMAVHGEDELNELSLTAPSLVTELRDGWIRSYRVTPEQFGLKRCDPLELAGGTAEQRRDIVLSVLEGERGPRRDVTVFNAAAALIVGGKADDFAQGLDLAARSIDSGAARGVLDILIETSNAEDPAA